ncbi:MAG: response regulator [Candidatus Scalindua rubra]|uniref:Response regulator n=1 Tax=Candidatus Scalindua rubra TaxID=1872076 RepID=A0A1E3X7G0_9BACT|nr:MAG: response regulator [Candidatus Scalindua rubra]
MAKVLIIDDSHFTRTIIRKLVKDIGHETIEAANGQEGLDKIINEKPDLVMTDLLMPEMDGIKLLEAVKEREADVSVIVISSNIQETVRQQCLELGAIEFFNKPPNKEKLQKLIVERLV